MFVILGCDRGLILYASVCRVQINTTKQEMNSNYVEDGDKDEKEFQNTCCTFLVHVHSFYTIRDSLWENHLLKYYSAEEICQVIEFNTNKKKSPGGNGS